MSAEGARVIDLEQYRRRRQAPREQAASGTFMPMMWVPVWVWVPVWSVI